MAMEPKGDKQKKVTVNGTDYLIQKAPAMWYLETSDKYRMSNGMMATSKYWPALLKNCVIDPVVTVDNFDGRVGELEELMGEVETFLRG